MGLVALFAAAPDGRCASTASVGALATYVQPDGYPAQPMGVLLPGILEWGDVAHVAAWIAPRRLLLANGVDGAGHNLDEATLKGLYADAATWDRQAGAGEALAIQAGATDAEVAAWWAWE